MKSGFTLVELLVTIAIIVILSVAAMPIYTNLQVDSQLNESTSLIIQTLRTAKERSEARLNNDNHGVWFGLNSYNLYQGGSYSIRNIDYDRVQNVDNSVRILTDIANNEVNFSKGFGLPDSTGTITLVHDTGEARYIVISSNGRIEEQ